MPGKNGIDVMREAKEAGIRPVFAILSGYDEFAYAQQALRYGAKEYLLKPVRAADILACPNRLADLYCEEEKKPPAPDGGTTAERLTARAKEVVSEHYMERLSLSVVAEKIGCSDNYLSTIFSQEAGCGFVDYVNRFRVERACLYLQQRTLKTYEIAYRGAFRTRSTLPGCSERSWASSRSSTRKGRPGSPQEAFRRSLRDPRKWKTRWGMRVTRTIPRTMAAAVLTALYPVLVARFCIPTTR